MMSISDPSPANSAILQVSLIIPARHAAHALEHTVSEAHAYLSRHFASSFEILLVPNIGTDSQDQSAVVASALAQKLSHIRVCPHQSAPGKGAALRTGFFESRGQWIFFTDSDLPYDLSFFDQATLKLKAGYDLVTGNRRIAQSHFVLPVHLLKLAYSRHRLGLTFNFLVRKLLNIHTTDTQAGIKALSRRLATEAFTRQSCPGFLFDLEIFLTAQSLAFNTIELPVTLHLNTEKSTVRVLRECISVGYWILRIWMRNLKGAYGRKQIHKPLPLYRSSPWQTRLFLFLRWTLTPYQTIASRLPPAGKILDLGCGHGLLALTAAQGSKEREVLGIDHDLQRITLASHAAKDLSNLRITSGDLTQLSAQSFAGIAMIDILHYFDQSTQENLLKQSWSVLNAGGTLLIREVDPAPGMISNWNRLYEKIATRIGFTQSNSQALYFRSKTEWKETLEAIGFQVEAERCSSFLFSDVLYICEKL